MEIDLPNKKTIRIFTAPYFIASKIAAFLSRGNHDLRTSPDFEDLIYVLDNRIEIVDELKHSENGLRKYVQQFLGEVLDSPDFDEGISAALPYGSGRAGIVRIRRIITDIVARKN
jgi:predicted nucleotidyltransferase